MAHSSALPEQVAGTNSAVLPPAQVPLLHEDPQAERIYCDQAFEFLRAHPGLCSPQNPIHYSTLHASLTNMGVHPPYGNSKKAKALSLKGFTSAPESAPDLYDSTAKGSESGSGNSSSSDTPTEVMDETSGRPKTKKAKADGGDAGAASAPAAVDSHEITQKMHPAVALHMPSFSAAAEVGTVRSTDGGRVSTAGCTAAPSRPCAAATAHSAPTAADCGSNTKCDDTKIMACLDLSRYLVTWMIMHPTISELHRYCIRMYVKLWADWMDSPPTTSAEGSDGIPDPPCFRTCAILSQFMLRERLKMKLSDSPWRAYANASLVIKNFLFIGAGNCSVSPIMLTQPPCPDDSEATDFSFNQRKALLKQFYEDNNIRFIVNVSGRDDFMRSAEYPISANRTYSAAETSDLFTNLEEQPLEALQTHLNGDHVTVFLMHMEDVEHWPQEQSVVLDCAAIGIEIAWRAHCYHSCHSDSEPPKVIVHCAGGINRSPATVVWWLCRYQGLHLQEAWDIVKIQRARMFGNDTTCVLKKKGAWFAKLQEMLDAAGGKLEAPPSSLFSNIVTVMKSLS